MAVRPVRAKKTTVKRGGCTTRVIGCQGTGQACPCSPFYSFHDSPIFLPCSRTALVALVAVAGSPPTQHYHQPASLTHGPMIHGARKY